MPPSSATRVRGRRRAGCTAAPHPRSPACLMPARRFPNVPTPPPVVSELLTSHYCLACRLPAGVRHTQWCASAQEAAACQQGCCGRGPPRRAVAAASAQDAPAYAFRPSLRCNGCRGSALQVRGVGWDAACASSLLRGAATKLGSRPQPGAAAGCLPTRPPARVPSACTSSCLFQSPQR